MKKLMILLLLIIGAREVRAQADPTHDVYGNNKQAVTKNISDFGGFPNDGIDDSKAFDSAARWFSNVDAIGQSVTNIDYLTTYGVLKLQMGTYEIGEQIIDNSPSATFYALPKYHFAYTNINGLIIEGQGINSTRIKINPNSYFGWFNKITHLPCIEKPNGVDVEGITAQPSTVFTLGYGVENMIIRNMELDGSSDAFHIGATQTNPGDYNLSWGFGISTLTARYLSFENLYIHNFGMDGIGLTVTYSPAGTGKWNVTMDSVRSFWNGRQALSWEHGRDVRIQNSVFAYTRIKEGTTNVISAVAGSPGCNIDIEPGYISLNPVIPGSIRNGQFSKCKIFGNPWPSASLAIQLDSDSLRFDSCEIKTGSAYWEAIGFSRLKNRNFIFNKCDITGTISFYRFPGEMTHLPDVGLTRFTNCNISGCENIGGSSLIEVHDRVLFDHCDIKQINQRPIFNIINKTNDGVSIPNPDFYTTLNNCNISSTYVSDPSAFDIRGRMYALRFTGNTKWTHDISSSPIAGQYLFFQNATLNGSSLYSPMNSFTFPNINVFEGSYFGYLVDPAWDPNAYKRPIIIGETPCEYLNVYIGEDNNVGGSVVRNEARPLYIGEGATITVRNGSYLILSGDIYLAGKIIIKTGGNIMYTEAIGVNGYPAVTAPSIHIFSSTSINDHIIFEDPSASANISGVPGLWTSTKFAQPLVAYNTLRSQLMAPNQYLRSAVVAERLKYDDPNIKCIQCKIDPLRNITTCNNLTFPPPPPGTYHPLRGIAEGSDFTFDSNDDIKIYPNPTNDKIYISTGNTDEKSDIQLLDINGRQLYKTSSKDAETEISLSKYPQGTYLIRISNASNSVVKKVVKTN